MNTTELEKKILGAVEEYLAIPEAWEDAQLTVDTLTGEADLVEAEEADSLPDTTDEYDIMDLVEMTPDGSWIADRENIASVAESYRKE